ncbi:MAG: hypothetical protein K2Q22_08940, partial [Cytophagales bacterium]|nr:hypothetical protein [Cytophagales bacterium]
NKMFFPYEVRRTATFDTIRFNLPSNLRYNNNSLWYGSSVVSNTRDTILRNNQLVFLPYYNQWTSNKNPNVSDTIPLSIVYPNRYGGVYQMRNIQYTRTCADTNKTVYFTFPKNVAAVTLPDSGHPVTYPKLDINSFLTNTNTYGYKLKGDSIYSTFPTPNLRIDPVFDNISSSPATLRPFTLYSTNGVAAYNVFMEVKTKKGNRFNVTSIRDSSNKKTLIKPSGSQVFHLGNVANPKLFSIKGTYSCKSSSDLSDTLMIRYGWTCDPYPKSADSATCSYNKLDTAYYYINGQESGIQLSEQITGPDSLNLCASNAFNYDMTPLNAYVYNFHNSLTLPKGVTADSAVYYLNGRNYPVNFKVVNGKVQSVSDSSSSLKGVGVQAGDRFGIRYKLNFPCGFNAATSILKVNAYGFSYCGVRIPAKDSLTSGFPSRIKGVRSPAYSISAPSTVALGCSLTSVVQIDITPISLSNVAGVDTLRILLPKELDIYKALIGATRKSGAVVDTIKFPILSPNVGEIQSFNLFIKRRSGLPYCGTRDIQYDIFTTRGVICPNKPSTCAVTFGVQNAKSQVQMQACGLAVPIVSGSTSSCGNTSQSYTITNIFPSGTSYNWTVRSYANNVNLTVSPNTSGIQGQVTFGDKPGVDTLIVSAYNSSGCASAPLKLPITTHQLPLTQTNFATRLFIDKLDGLGQNILANDTLCASQRVALEAKRTAGSPNSNRVGIPFIGGITYNWQLAGANIIPTSLPIPSFRVVEYPTSGRYPIVFSGITGNGCIQSIKDTITIKTPLPTPIINGVTSICGNSDTSFTV